MAESHSCVRVASVYVFHFAFIYHILIIRPPTLTSVVSLKVTFLEPCNTCSWHGLCSQAPSAPGAFTHTQKHVQLSTNWNSVWSQPCTFVSMLCLLFFRGFFFFFFFCYSYCRKACSPYDWASETASAHTLVLCFQSVLSCIHKVRTETARALHKTENNCPCMLHIPWSTVAGQRDKTCCLGNAPLK